MQTESSHHPTLIGRIKDIEILQTKLNKGTSVISISGPPMCGKSRLATELLKLINENECTSYIFNLTGKDHPTALTSELSALLCFKQIPTTEELVKRLSEISKHRKTVLLFDNCDDILNLPASKSTFICLCYALASVKKNIQVILTAAIEMLFPRLKPSDVYLHRVEPLTLKESSQLFYSVCEYSELDDQLRHELLKRLGGLPYPIIMVASQLKFAGVEANQLIGSFLESFPHSPNERFSFDTVLSVIQNVLQKLEEEKRRASAVLSYLEGSFGLDIARLLLDCKSNAFTKHTAIIPLMGRCVLTPFGKRYIMPPIIRAFVDKEFSNLRNEPVIFGKFCSFFTDILKTIIHGMESRESSKHFVLLADEYPHIRNLLLKVICNKEEEFETFYTLATDGEDILDLFPFACSVFIENLLQAAELFGTPKQQGYLKAIRGTVLYQTKADLQGAHTALEDSRAQLEPLGQSEALAAVYQKLGYNYYLTCKAKLGIEYCEKAVTIYKGIEMWPSKQASKTLNIMGNNFTYIKNLEQGKICNTESYNMRKHLFGENFTHGAVLNSLGLVYSISGNHREALPYFEASLRCRKKYYNNRPCEPLVISLHNVAKEHYYLEDYSKSVSILKETLEVREEIGTKHLNDSLVHNSLGMVYYEMKQYETARSHFENATVVRKQHLGRHLSTVKSLNGLGQTLVKLHKPEMAITVLREAADMGEDLFRQLQVEYTQGEIYLHLAHAYNDVGEANNSRHMYSLAKDTLQRTLEQFIERNEDFNIRYTKKLISQIPVEM